MDKIFEKMFDFFENKIKKEKIKKYKKKKLK
jgi:hypothetical protein